MRIWHIDFIDTLPREQLVAQWRELSAIAGAIQKSGTPNHILVNFVLDYDFDDFISYASFVRTEMSIRGYRTMDSVWNKIVALKPTYTLKNGTDIYKEKMNKEYLTICYYNLKEKYLCGGINQADWDKIATKFAKRTLLYES